MHGLRCLLLLALARPFGLAQIDFLPRCQAIYLALSTMYRHQIQYGSYTARLVLCVCRWICYLHACPTINNQMLSLYDCGTYFSIFHRSPFY